MCEIEPADDGNRRSDFNSLACDYAKFRTSYSEALFDLILRYAATPPDGRVLDLACGTGLGMVAYVRRGLAVTGIDLAPAMLEQARAAMPLQARVEFVIGQAEALPFANASFDLISCAQAFHWFEARAAFTECARVLRPGGALAIFWKHAAADDALTDACEQIIREWLGDEAAVRSRDHAIEHETGWPLFWQHVARAGSPAGSQPLVDGQKHVLEFTLSRTADEFVGYQRSREKIRKVLGERRSEFLAELDRRLQASLPEGRAVTQRQIQYVFLARKSA